jgi:DNA primase/energy-coupling factor transporter ATP-binding protein EcfA2
MEVFNNETLFYFCGGEINHKINLDMEIQDIKQRLSILQVLACYNIQPDRHHQILCPFHPDDKPSCKIYPKTNTYHCFGCGKTGDAIQFIQDKEGITKHEAILKAGSFINPPSTPTPQSEKPQSAPTEKPFTELFGYFKESIARSTNAQNYCASRGLAFPRLGETGKGVEIGYNSGEKWNKLKQCLIFPLKDKQGNIVSLYGRRITNSKGYGIEYGKHYYSENRSGLYPGYPNQGTQTLIITEAIIDAATLQLTVNEQLTVLAAYGTNGLTKEHKQAIAEWAACPESVEGKEIIFFFDGDTAGREGVQRNAEEFKTLVNCRLSMVTCPEGEDVNSLYVNYGTECLLQLINERKPINENSLSIEIPSIEEKTDVPISNGNSPNELDLSNPNKIIFEGPAARYIVKGSLCKQLDKMLVSLDVQHLETAIKYRTRLDLYEEKQTRKESREAAEKLDLRSDLIETDLSKLTDLLEELREKEYQDASIRNQDNEILLSLAEQAKCKAFLQQAGLMEKLNALVGKSGITGEANNRLFLFVIAVSHRMPDTLHALIQGSSGSGKTHLLSKIADLMPSERVVKFTRVTENSFYNYDEYFFKGKLICLEDIDGLKEEALFAWRELISNNQLSSSTSQKDENGNIRSAQRIVRGPMASICATTHGQIYEDNMSRLFIIAVDESQAQTARIMDYQKQKAAGLIDSAEEKETTAFIQNLVRMLKPCKVVNPFAYQIHLPEKAHKIRRLNELYLAFVKQITIINQYQRKKDGQGRIITDTDDLETANDIMFDSIFLKVDELDGSLRQFYEELKNHINTKPNPEQYEFMQREIRHSLNISKSQLQRYINDLIELEYLQQMGGYQNRGFRYKIVWWDDIAKLREDVKQYLKCQIDKLKIENQQ